MSGAGPKGPRLGLGLSEDVDLLRFEQQAREAEAAPGPAPATPGEWIRQNLFSGPVNALLTLASGTFVLFVAYQILSFVFVSAQWEVVQVGMRGYMIGGFPVDEAWRVWASAYLVIVLAGLSYGVSARRLRPSAGQAAVGAVIVAVAGAIVFFTAQTALVRALTAGVAPAVFAGALVGRLLGRKILKPLVVAWVLVFPAIMIVVRGFDGVPPSEWEGFFFNIIAATVGIVASFPLGLLLALGRRSELPAVRVASVGFIELFRGVPLVAWLIFSKFVVDLVLPPQMVIPDIVKAFVAMTFFSAAYVGEIVRGGLQGVPAGQYEAARALGLSTTRMMALIVLPQALRSTIPAMISHFISLFKDTSLFVAIEVTDLLAAARRSASSLQYFGRDMETLLFAGLIFWAVAFSMSRWSQRLEVRLGVGRR
ncbi:MAG: amino acid ABC transporter permease [Actinobacteria bacterium]|nr:amino acid ABC transporter permease [Actinomycetota bacterium]MDQ3532829.1 amino acid ABC transporter permease [Actinomycetota bacterium]